MGMRKATPRSLVGHKTASLGMTALQGGAVNGKGAGEDDFPSRGAAARRSPSLPRLPLGKDVPS